jgi:iron complex transport system substrate-binding protein
MANFINDAGGNYLFKNEKARESLNLSIEQVMMEGQQADLWIHTGMANSLNDILASDDRLAQLPAYKNKQVYNNNKRQNNYGGNDFWESGVMNPHLILKDLFHIFHPQLNTDTNLYYYQKLN